MRLIYTHKIDWENCKGLGLTPKKLKEYFNDGRPMGRFAEFIIEEAFDGIRENENSKFDIIENNGIKSEIRTITKEANFAASKETGYGRKVTKEGFQEKLDSLDRYIFADIRKIEDGIVNFIEVTKDNILYLPLGINKTISAKKFYEIYDRIKQDI